MKTPRHGIHILPVWDVIMYVDIGTAATGHSKTVITGCGEGNYISEARVSNTNTRISVWPLITYTQLLLFMQGRECVSTWRVVTERLIIDWPYSSHGDDLILTNMWLDGFAWCWHTSLPMWKVSIAHSTWWIIWHVKTLHASRTLNGSR